MKVLFVCSGNICRSPMAAEYFRHRAVSRGLNDCVVDSAGTLRIRGAPASTEAIEAMAEIGVDLTRHRSQALDASVLEDADYTIVMEHDHLDYLAQHHPEGEDRRLMIRAFEQGPRPSSSPRDLDDPMGHELDYYRDQVPLLVRCLDNLVEHLRERR